MSNLRASTVAITTIMYLAAVSMVVAQPTYYRVTFTDKGPDTFVPGSSAYNEALAAFHPRSLQRRAQVGMDPLLTKEDQPVDADYVQEILDLGIADPVVIHWRNCMIVNTDTITANRIKALPFVDSLVRTNTVAYTPLIDDCGPARPGENRRIHQALNTGTMIDAGVSGKGARVALLDNGFRLQRMTSLAHADIVATHDVIYGDDDVANGPNDPPEQDGHGSLVLSIAASWEQDSIIGVAPFASYLLVKTEDMRFERRVEEDFYTAAVEWAERNGADILSSSLGYRGFDSTEEQTPYRWFDGRSTFFSQAISMAVQRGMLCISAAGNGGPQDSTLYLPADADSGIAVGGSLWPSGFAWGMTSSGPTADGRAKPDLAALGGNVLAQTRDGTYIRASGTSMAAPQIAGVAAHLVQLYPDAPPWLLRQALYTSCSLIRPDETRQLGRGLPDAVKAARWLGGRTAPGIGEAVVIESGGQQRVLCAVFTDTTVDVSLLLKDQVGSPLRADLIDTLWYGIDLAPELFTTDTLYGRLRARGPDASRYWPSDSTWFPITRKGHQIPCGVRLPSTIVTVERATTLERPSTRERTPTLFPNPAQSGTRFLGLTNVQDVFAVWVTSTTSGERTSCSVVQHPDGRHLLSLPPLASGHYMVVITSPTSLHALPLIIH